MRKLGYFILAAFLSVTFSSITNACPQQAAAAAQANAKYMQLAKKKCTKVCHRRNRSGTCADYDCLEKWKN